MVDSTTTDTVTVCQFTLRMILRNVDNQIELVFGNHLHHVVLCVRTFIGPVNSFSAHSMSIQESGCTCRCINLISFIEEHAAGLQQIYFRFHGTGREHHSLLRNLEASSNHGAQQCFGEIITDTAYFTGRRHIHTQYRVCLVQTGERELRSFHTNPVDIECRLVRTSIRSIQHDAGSSFNKVTLQHLRHERETT